MAKWNTSSAVDHWVSMCLAAEGTWKAMSVKMEHAGMLMEMTSTDLDFSTDVLQTISNLIRLAIRDFLS